ncbi:hypothetical protein ACEPAG_3852 [Sanghuangporus baumii]
MSSSVNVDFTNTGTEIATISFTDHVGNAIGPIVIRPNQVIRRKFEINFSYFFTFGRGRHEQTTTHLVYLLRSNIVFFCNPWRPPNALNNTKYPSDCEIRRFQKEDFLTADGTFAWKAIQELVLTCHGWLGFVEGTSPRPDVVIYPEEAEYWNQMDCAVKLQLAFNIDFRVLSELLADDKTSYALWKTLNDRFGRKTSHERFTANSRLNAKRL